MEFKIENLDWYKRRKPTKEPVPISADVQNFEKVEYHQCDVFVEYDDGVTRKLIGRVLYNDIKETWAINALANGGFAVKLRLIE